MIELEILVTASTFFRLPAPYLLLQLSLAHITANLCGSSDGYLLPGDCIFVPAVEHGYFVAS
jgi:hypothetical protein